MEGAPTAKSGDAAEDRNAAYAVLILQNIEYFLHERFAAAMVAFLEVDADDRNIALHQIAPDRFRAM
jgi:hypothetical protein